MKSLAKSKGGDLQSVSNQESQTQYSEVLALFNQKYSKAAGQEGAFLLKAGYGINPRGCM